MEKLERMYNLAWEIAKRAHQGQRDKGGNPYIQHPLAVAEAMDTPELKIVALLHDVLEDSDLTEEDLRKQGFSDKIVEAVCVLTHSSDRQEDYMNYIERVKKNPMARAVKIADLTHNMDLSRIPNPGPRDYARRRKYENAYKYLTEI